MTPALHTHLDMSAPTLLATATIPAHDLHLGDLLPSAGTWLHVDYTWLDDHDGPQYAVLYADTTDPDGDPRRISITASETLAILRAPDTTPRHWCAHHGHCSDTQECPDCPPFVAEPIALWRRALAGLPGVRGGAR